MPEPCGKPPPIGSTPTNATRTTGRTTRTCATHAEIPTLFFRNPATHTIEPTLSDGCAWVLAGEGRPTRKVDGTAVLIRDGKAFKRRELKPDRPRPDDFEHVETDPVTGKQLGWVLIDLGDRNDQYFVEAIKLTRMRVAPPEGDTYEMVGPKVQRD